MRFGFKLSLVVAVLLFCGVSAKASPYEIRPISHNLWIPLDKKDKDVLSQISIHLAKKEYNKALNLLDSFQKIDPENPDPKTANPFFLNKTDLKGALRNVILWHKYSDLDVESENGDFSFSDLSRFVVDNGFYPNIEDLRGKVEVLVRRTDTPYRVSSQYFKSNPASKTESKMFLIESKEKHLKSEESVAAKKDEMIGELRSEISLTWIGSNYLEEQEKEYLEKYGGILTNDDHVKRIERLIWDKEYDQASNMLKLIDDDHEKYYANIIQILRYPKELRRYVRAIPREFRYSELSYYAQTRWYFKKDETKKAVKMLKKIDQMTMPDQWWGLRLVYGRELLKSDDSKDAYRIVSNHGLTEDSKKYWEAQWTSGWIALRFRNEPEIAYSHFKKLYDHVKQPVTIARATYWLGMAAQASGNEKLALKWYKEASGYPLYFYGQLAIHKRRALDPLNSDGEIILPKDPQVKIADAQEVSGDLEVKVAYLLALLGDKKNASEIFKGYISKSKSSGQIAAVMRLASEFDDYEMDSIVSRAAENKNVFFIRRKFRMVKEVEDDENLALIHAIIKQESGFVPHAESRVGALGYMQLMPGTAKNVAKDLGVRYNKNKLSQDVAYNVKLGSHYIKQMVDRFEGSKMLAIAAYNAGPHNSDRWIKEFYDPRKEKDIDKVVDWIELITYSETRNYVQRIMENLIVYKYIANKPS